MEINRKEIYIWALTILLMVGMGFIIPMLNISGVFSGFQSQRVLSLFLLLGIVLFTTVTVLRKHHKHIGKIVYIGLGARLFVLILIGFYGILPYTYDDTWDILANNLLSEWNSGNFNAQFDASLNVRYYTILVTSIYYIFGYNPIFMMILNVLFGTLTIIVIYYIGRELFNKRVGKWAAGIFAFWPSHIMFSAMNMRDSLAILLMSLFILKLLKWFKNFQFSDMFWLVLLFIGNTLIRSQNAVLLAAVAAPFIMYYLFKKTNPILKPLWFMVGIAGIVGGFGLVYALGYANEMNINYIISEMDYRSSGGSAYLTSLHYTSWVDVIKYLPVRLVYFVFSPFPWQVNSISQALSGIEGVILMWFTFVILRKWKVIKKLATNKAMLWTFILFCLFGLMSNAVIDSNSGTAMRHKLQFIYVIFILYAATKVNTADLNKDINKVS